MEEFRRFLHKSKYASPFIGGYALLFIYLMYRGYYIGDTTFWVGLIIAPYILIIKRLGDISWRFGIITIGLLVLCFFVKTYSVRYLLLVFAVLFAIESSFGKLNALLLWLLLIISPIFRYVSEIFSFPIRIKLSEIVGIILQKSGFPISVSGNMIQYKNADFSVDAACMGLQMIGLSMLVGLFLLAHYERHLQRKIPYSLMILTMILVFLMNILSNLTRIIILVVFHILPENLLHDFIGIICLLVYVWLPCMFLVKWLFANFSKPRIEKEISQKHNRFYLIFNLFLLGCASYIVLSFIPQSTYNQVLKSNRKGYITTNISFGITQYIDSKSLIYTKPIADFYSGEHSPIICWKASGFEFKSVKETAINDKKVYIGTLKKGNEILYTSWWFSNNKMLTISQLDWRWRVFKGEPKFHLVNVTVAKEADLKMAIKAWL